MNRTEIRPESSVPKPRRANDCVDDPRNVLPPAFLFDRFWLEGELALCFGAPSVGKTVLAVQIAEAIARGEPIDALLMHPRPRRVLYVDLVHTGEQFHRRRCARGGRTYNFSANFHRAAPPKADAAGLIAWLREVVPEYRYKVVVVDDLTALRSTSDGTRETLKFMRELRALCRELSISVLVLAQSRPVKNGRMAGEGDLMRSRVLCDAADSVFAIGRHPYQADWSQIVQIRSRNAPIYWTGEGSPCCIPERRDDGLLAMRFDSRFIPYMDARTLRAVRVVKGLRDTGDSVRAIAAKTGLSRSKIERLLKKWRPSMGTEPLEGVEKRTAASPPAHAGRAAAAASSPECAGTPPQLALVENANSCEREPRRDTSPEPAAIPATMDELFRACGCTPDVNGDGVPVWTETLPKKRFSKVMYVPRDRKSGYVRWESDGTRRFGSEVDGPVRPYRCDFM